MSISSWFNNNKIDTAYINYRGYGFLVYTCSVGAHRVVLVEEIRSGIREIPTEHRKILSETDMDNVIREIMDKIINQNFSTDV